MTAENSGQTVSFGITDKINAEDLLCMQECCQTRDRTYGHLIGSNTRLIELSSPSVKSVVYVKADLRLMNVVLNPKF